MTKTALLSVLGGVAFVALVGACLFVSAGRSDLPWFWAYLGVWAAAMVAGSCLIDPTLVQERIRPGPGGRDYGTVVVLTPLMLGQSLVAGLDVGRSHWSDGAPSAVQGTGLLLWPPRWPSWSGPWRSIASFRRCAGVVILSQTLSR